MLSSMSLPAANNLKPPYLSAAEELRDNPGQWQAYESQGNCVILAGPGSGKTKTLTVKIARMLAEEVQPPRGIACLTFNSECVRELKGRLDRLGVQAGRNLFVGTVHSFCLKNLILPYGSLANLNLPHEIEVASPTEQARLFAGALEEEIGGNQHPTNWKVRVDEYRRTHLDREKAYWLEDEELAMLVEAYEKKLRSKSLIDFDDMVLLGLKLVEGYPWVGKALRARWLRRSQG